MITRIKQRSEDGHILLQLSPNKPIPPGFFSNFPEVMPFRRDFWGRVYEIEVMLPNDQVNGFLQHLINKGYATLDTPLFIDDQESAPLRNLLPPPLPETVIAGFNSEGYWQLIQSLPDKDRKSILEELRSPAVIRRAKKLEGELARNDYICTNTDNTRLTFLAALLCVQQNKIGINQLATLHLLDSAIQTLYVSPYSYLIYKYSKDSKISRNYDLFAASKEGLPNTVRRFPYNLTIVPNEKTTITDLPERMQHPLVHRFFNFTPSEWHHFCQEMQSAPHTEQFIHVLIAPEFGCWSSLIFHIQKYLKCMRTLDWLIEVGDNVMTETIMVIPSFSMFQAAINVKAKALERSSLHLIPTYGYLDAEPYARLKTAGCIPVAMYLPEQKPKLQYNSQKGGFRMKIDGHPYETSFAGAIHDVYHALRELCMSEGVATARLRLAEIAKNHPNNQISPKHRAIDNILIDGELIFNYSPTQDTIFSKKHRSNSAEIFGDLFYDFLVHSNLHADLKRAFIYDMVSNQEDWLESFHLGKTDLRPDEQAIYEEIEAELLPEQSSLRNNL